LECFRAIWRGLARAIRTGLQAGRGRRRYFFRFPFFKDSSKTISATPRTLEKLRTISDSWPDFFIVGTVRGATTSLYEYLKKSTGIYMSPVKEPRFFSGDFERRQKVADVLDYHDLFRGATKSAIMGEATPSYLADPEAAGNIYSQLPTSKIIIVLRDPTARAFSHWHFNRVRGEIAGKREHLTFREAIQAELEDRRPKFFGLSRLYVELGFYSRQVKRYIDTFGSRQIKIVIFEEFIRDTGAQMSEILEFLGVESEGLSFDEVHNAAQSFSPKEPRGSFASSLLKSPLFRAIGKAIPTQLRSGAKKKILLRQTPKPQMRPEDRAFLNKLYHEDVLELEKILGQKMKWLSSGMDVLVKA